MVIQKYVIKRDNKPDETFSIRRRTSDDHDDIINLYLSVPEDELDFFITDIRNPKSLSQWFEPNEFVETLALVAVVNDHIVGEAVLVRQKDTRTSHVGTVRFYVHPDWRTVGIGTVLITSLLTESMNIGIEKISVSLPESANRRFKSTLTKSGFSQEAVLKNHFRTESGAKQNIVIYGRDLDELWNRISDWVGNYGRAMEY
jgi:GNAT superfamily N-acetyltransferase